MCVSAGVMLLDGPAELNFGSESELNLNASTALRWRLTPEESARNVTLSPGLTVSWANKMLTSLHSAN
jgi:hypothetical protein